MQSNGDFRWLASRLTPWRWRLACGRTCILHAALALIIDPLLMRSLIDTALPQHDRRLSLELVAGIGACYLFNAVFYALSSIANLSVAQSCVRDLRLAILKQNYRLSTDYHERTPTTDKVTRIEDDVTAISDFGADAAVQSITTFVVFEIKLS